MSATTPTQVEHADAQELAGAMPVPEWLRAAGRTLRDTPPWLRPVVQGRGYRLSRALPAGGVGLDLLVHLQEGRDPVEAAARAGGAGLGAWAGGKTAASVGAPLLGFGPPGWLAYGGGVIGGSVFGGFLGDTVVGSLFIEDLDANLWVSDWGREGLPEPGPVREIE